MKIVLIVVGRTEEDYLKEGIAEYCERLRHYINFEFIDLQDNKFKQIRNKQQRQSREGELLLKNLETSDFVVLLDERGKQYTSEAFAEFIQQKINESRKRLVFIVGGAYGFSDAMYQRANAQLSLSKMTFSHQMVRLFFAEQLYRAFTIIKGEAYHHK